MNSVADEELSNPKFKSNVKYQEVWVVVTLLFLPAIKVTSAFPIPIWVFESTTFPAVLNELCCKLKIQLNYIQPGKDNIRGNVLTIGVLLFGEGIIRIPPFQCYSDVEIINCCTNR